MPTPTGGLLEVTLNQTYLGRPCANIFYFWNSANIEPSSFTALADDFETKYLDNIAVIQSASVLYDNIRFRTILGTLPDFVRNPATANGNKTGDPTPSTIAAGFRYNGTTKETRSGYKRFCGIVETDIQGNDLQPAYLTELATLAGQLEVQLDSGTTVYDPVIYSPFTQTRATKVVNTVAEIRVYLKNRIQSSRYVKV